MIILRPFFCMLLLVFSCAEIKISKFNTIDGIKIPDISDEEAGYKDKKFALEGFDQYVTPNETNPNLYAKSLSSIGGTLLSVGTFRALIAFTLGEFDRLIMVDIANGIVLFNRKHLSFIKQLIEDRKYANDPEAQRRIYASTYKKYLGNFAKSNETYYWEDNNKWQKITEALKNNKIQVVRGNLAAIEPNKILLEVLLRLKTRLTLDLSNLHDYADQIQYSALLRKFAEISAQKQLAIMATDWKNKNSIKGYEQYSIGADSDGKAKIPWIYYFFPDYQHYISFITTKPKRE